MQLRRFLSPILRTMSGKGVYRARINPIAGQMEWVVEDETYDFYQEIARSGYADMLHDHERNVLFHEALKNVVDEVKKRGDRAHVMDIGAGTGLLSMMAASAGADQVTACEAFDPMAQIAKRIIATNGFCEKIRLLEKRSTDLTTDDMIDGKANILVAEVFDTELIGEGALRTFSEAHERLLTPNARVIPKSGTVFVQVVSSNLIGQWSGGRPLSVEISGNRLTIQPPQSFLQCIGNSPVVHDLQLEQVPLEELTFLTEPIPVLEFDFENSSALKFDGSAQVNTVTVAEGYAQAVLMWWDLDMDVSGKLILSTKPSWDKNQQSQWRDHWMQAIYYLPNPCKVTKDQQISVIGSHDEHSLWFDIKEGHDLVTYSPPPICECTLHTVCSRGNIGFLNDQSRYQRILSALAKVVPGKVCLCISDCSLLSIFALKLGAQKVFTFQTNQLYNRILGDYAKANGIQVDQDLIFISDFNQIPDDAKIDCIFGDPFFFQSMLPWHNIHFWYKSREARKSGRLAEECRIFPKYAHMKGMVVESRDLWKIKAPVHNVQGFDLKLFDGIVQKAIELCDAPVEPQPLWEYPSIALSRPTHLATFNLEEDIPEKKVSIPVQVSVERPGKMNMMAIWVEWQFGESALDVVSCGLKMDCQPGDQPDWDRNCRQGVYFFRYPFREVKEGHKMEVKVVTMFDPGLGEISFEIEKPSDS